MPFFPGSPGLSPFPLASLLRAPVPFEELMDGGFLGVRLQ